MRTAYHEKLAALSEQIGQMCGLAAAAIDNATQALLRADLALAERVITDHMQMAEMSVAAERSAVSLLALQQPVAGELRAIFGSSQIVADVDRMGALAVHVAKISRHRHPRHAVPAEVDGCFAEMGRVAVELATRAQEVLRSHDPDKAAGLRGDDDVIDNLYRDLLTVVMDRNWAHGVPAAVDAAFLGRFYERFADHAVEIGRRVVFEVTGTMPVEQEVSTY
jgi:phosphate transport system protein